MLGECPNFQGGMGGKIRENGPKTGNSIAMRKGKWEIQDQNFGKSPGYLFLDIQLQFCCIITKYIPKSKMLS